MQRSGRSQREMNQQQQQHQQRQRQHSRDGTSHTVDSEQIDEVEEVPPSSYRMGGNQLRMGRAQAVGYIHNMSKVTDTRLHTSIHSLTHTHTLIHTHTHTHTRARTYDMHKIGRVFSSVVTGMLNTYTPQAYGTVRVCVYDMLFVCKTLCVLLVIVCLCSSGPAVITFFAFSQALYSELMHWIMDRQQVSVFACLCAQMYACACAHV
jgi:hypothetical protein